MSVSLTNERFLKLLSVYLNFREDCVTASDVRAVTAAGVDETYAFALLLAENLGVDTDGEDKKFFHDYFIPSIKKLDVADYYSDDYFRLVNFDERSLGAFTLKKMTCPAYRAFVRDDFEYLPDGRVIPQIGFFGEDYRYPAALSDGREWMTLLPNEINSQKKYIDAAFGKVATYGLGLGYYAFKVAKKSEVSSVTVVDIDENAVKLFKEVILPCFPKSVAKKIRLVTDDAFEFARSLHAGDFDYIYADIWHDVSDAVSAIEKFKEYEKFCPTAKFGYWIEDTVKYYL